MSRASDDSAVELPPVAASQYGSHPGELRLPPTQRRVVRYINTHTKEAALLSSTELAARIGVSQATITRVAVALGYSGFTSMRDELRRALYDAPPTTGVQPAVQTSIEHLETLHGMLDDPESLRRAAETLTASRPLPIVAVRISEPLGRYISYRLGRCHPDVRCIDRGDSIGADSLISAIDAGASALLCVNLPRHAAETLAIVDLARDHRLRIIMITDHAAAPGASQADIVFAIPVGTGLTFDSHAAPTVFASILVDAMTDALGSAGQQRLEMLEEVSTTWGTFVD